MAGEKAGDPPPTFQQQMEALKKGSSTPEVSMSVTKGPEPVSSDPVERAVNWGAEHLVPDWTPDLLRTAGRFVIPQNAPEAALAIALSPIPGGTLAKGPLKWVANKTLPSFLARTGLTAATTSGVGALTGHDPTESAMLGAGGRMVGEATGAILNKVVQSRVVNAMFDKATNRVADTFKDLIGPWLPKKAKAEAVIRDVIADRPSKRVGAAINDLRAKHADTLVNVLDLQPELEANGVVHTWTPGATAGPGRVDPGTVKAGMVWPPTREFEKGIGAGTDVTRYGSLESSTRRLGTGESGGGMVRFGEISGALEAEIEKVSGALKKVVNAGGDAETRTQLALRLQALEGMQTRVDGRIADPQMQEALKQYARTKQLRDWLWGAERAPHDHAEKVVGELLDKDGRLSKEGVILLQKRLIGEGPRLSYGNPRDAFRTDEVVALQRALNLDLAESGARAEVGRGLNALLPSMTLNSGIIPRFHWSGPGPGPGSMPGWEAQRSLWQRMYPDLFKVLTGTGIPAAVQERYGTRESQPPEQERR